MATSIRLELETENRLNHLAKETGRSKAFYLRCLIEDGLEDLEDLYLAEQSLIEVRSGKSRTWSLAEVERELGLAD